METRKSRAFPIIITFLIILIIVYLFITVKEPFVECQNTTTNDLNIKVVENVKTTLDSRKVKKIEVTKKQADKFIQINNVIPMDFIEFIETYKD